MSVLERDIRVCAGEGEEGVGFVESVNVQSIYVISWWGTKKEGKKDATTLRYMYKFYIFVSYDKNVIIKKGLIQHSTI